MSEEEISDVKITPVTEVPAQVLTLVLAERDYQIKRWGRDHDKSHKMVDWLNIMTVYTGKVGMASELYSNDRAAFKKRVKQLAAICLAALEAVEEE